MLAGESKNRLRQGVDGVENIFDEENCCHTSDCSCPAKASLILRVRAKADGGHCDTCGAVKTTFVETVVRVECDEDSDHSNVEICFDCMISELYSAKKKAEADAADSRRMWNSTMYERFNN